MKIMIDPGHIPMDIIKRLNHKKNQYIFISESEQSIDALLKNGFKARAYPIKESLGKKSFFLSRNSLIPTSDVQKIIEDPVIFMLFDRWIKNIDSNVIKIKFVSIYVNLVKKLILSEPPDIVVFRACPHSIFTYLFYKVCMLLNVPTFYFMDSVLPWRTMVARDVRIQPELVDFGSRNIGEVENDLINDFILKKKGSKDEAMPNYELQRLNKNNGKFFNLKQEIIHWWKRPDLIINKLLMFREYERVAATTDFLPENYVVFFLHYQPERTSLPEGYGFTQQYLAIQSLARAIPESWRLLVKEHPSTFTNKCEWTQRRKNFYNNLRYIESVEVVNMKMNSYTLMDNAQAVASLTGTVLFESLLRNTPSIAFGGGPLQKINSDFFHRFENDEKLKKFLYYIEHYENKGNTDIFDCWSYLLDTQKYCINYCERKDFDPRLIDNGKAVFENIFKFLENLDSTNNCNTRS